MRWTFAVGIVLAVLAMAGGLYLVEHVSAGSDSRPSDSRQKTLIDHRRAALPAERDLDLERHQTRLKAHARLAAIEAETDSDRKDEEFDLLMASIPDNGLPTVLDSLVADTQSAAAELRQLLVRRWAEYDPCAAASWVLGIREANPASRAATEQVAIAWAETDLLQAVDWARSLPAAENRQAAAIAIGYEAARSDPLVALELCSDLPPGAERDDLLVHAVSQWADTDPAAATVWTGEVTDAELRQRLTAAIAVAAAEHDPFAAATLLTRDVPPGALQDGATVAIVQRWAQQSPPDAAGWVLQFPDTPVRVAAVRALLSIWRRQSGDSTVPPW